MKVRHKFYHEIGEAIWITKYGYVYVKWHNPKSLPDTTIAFYNLVFIVPAKGRKI